MAGALALALTVTAPAENGPHRLGVGAHYWTAMGDVNIEDVDKDGFSWLATYQYRPGAIGLGVDLEWMDKGFGGSEETVYEPQAYLILGQSIYAAAGIGGYYTDDGFADDPFYFFRAGLDLELFAGIRLDVHAIYRFETWDSLNEESTDIDTDTITLGAALRFSF
jgi:hypothetical protein